MKNVIKKITAAAMALALLSTGTTVISPNSHNTFIAHAEFAHNCSSYERTKYLSWELKSYEATKFPIIELYHVKKEYKRTIEHRCAVCDKLLYSVDEYKTEEYNAAF